MVTPKNLELPHITIDFTKEDVAVANARFCRIKKTFEVYGEYINGGFNLNLNELPHMVELRLNRMYDTFSITISGTRYLFMINSTEWVWSLMGSPPFNFDQIYGETMEFIDDYVENVV